MTAPPLSILSIDEAFVRRRMAEVRSRLVYIAPGVTKTVAEGLIEASRRQDVSLTVVVDPDEDVYRIGYGDPDGLKLLHEAIDGGALRIMKLPGLRIGLLVADDSLLFWAPTPRAVEAERTEHQPNALMLAVDVPQSRSKVLLPDPGGDVAGDATTLDAEEVSSVLAKLAENPPAPFDLARKTRVFSTRFQFVECEVRGAEWTSRRIRLSSLLLNADLPDELHDILDTQIRPYRAAADLKLEVPLAVDGRPAFERDGSRMRVLAAQSDIMHQWEATRARYLRNVKGFGWLIRRDQLAAFRAEVQVFEETLRAWVDAFKEYHEKSEDEFLDSIVKPLQGRLSRAVNPRRLERLDLREEVKRGLDGMRVIPPAVRIVVKDVSWESSRDAEFMNAFREAVPDEEAQGWIEEFYAAREREER